MTDAPDLTALHTCDVCRKTSPWTDDWQWYGSLKHQGDCGHIVRTCSDACRARPKAARLIGSHEATHFYNCKVGNR